MLGFLVLELFGDICTRRTDRQQTDERTLIAALLRRRRRHRVVVEDRSVAPV